jgi:transcriptional regulator with XRE-family HTH domain
MADLQETLGAVIRKERRRRRRTMAWLAERAAISLVYLGEIERGKKYPSALVLERLAWALALPVSVMLELVANELRAGEGREPVNAIGIRVSAQPEAKPLSTGSRALEYRLAA